MKHWCRKRVDLLVDRGDDRREAVAGVLAGDPAGEVEVDGAVDGLDLRTLGAARRRAGAWRRRARRSARGLRGRRRRRCARAVTRGDSLPPRARAQWTAGRRRQALSWTRVAENGLLHAPAGGVASWPPRPSDPAARDADRPGHHRPAGPRARARRRRVRQRQRDSLGARLRAGRPDAVARGRRAPDHDRARRRPADAARSASTSAGLAGTGSPASPSASASAGPSRPRRSSTRRSGSASRVVTVPYEVPFIALTKAIAAQLANAQLARLERALEVHERLAHAVLEGRGAPALLAIVGEHAGCSLALVDEAGRIVGERNGARLETCENVLALPVVADGETWSLRAGKPGGELTEYDRLVLHHGQTALAFELSRRHAVSAAELRLAGDLLEDLEHDRLDEREVARRIAAFGLDPSAATPRCSPSAGEPHGGRRSAPPPRAPSTSGASATSRRRGATGPHSSSRPTARRTRSRSPTSSSARRPASASASAVPRPAPALGRSLLEARAALDAVAGPVASYRDLGSLELLLSLPSAALEAFVARVLGPAATQLVADRVAHRAARQRLPLERGGRPPRRPSAHAPLPDGAAAQADGPPSRRSRRSGWSSGWPSRRGRRSARASARIPSRRVPEPSKRGMRRVWFAALQLSPAPATIRPCPRPS